MKYILPLFLSLCLFGIASPAWAQQVPVFNQYILQSDLYNPARMGEEAGTKLYMSYRKQWLGIDDSPESQLVGINAKLNESSPLGIGFVLTNDKAHIIGRTSATAFVGYQVIDTKTSRLSTGISLGVINQRINFSNNLVINDLDDPLIFNTALSKTVLDAGIGVHYSYMTSNSQLNVGLATSQLPATLDGANDLVLYGVKSHLLGSLSYRYDVNRDLSIEPGLMYRGLAFAGSSKMGGGNIDLYFRVFLKEEKISAAVGLRPGAGSYHGSFGIGLDRYNRLKAIGTYEITRSLGSTFELGLGYRMGGPDALKNLPCKPKRRDAFWLRSSDLEGRLASVQPKAKNISVKSILSRDEVEIIYTFEDEGSDYYVPNWTELNALTSHIGELISEAIDPCLFPSLEAIRSVVITTQLRDADKELKYGDVAYEGEMGDEVNSIYIYNGQGKRLEVSKGGINNEELAALKLLSMKNELSSQLNILDTKFTLTLSSDNKIKSSRETSVTFILTRK